MSILLSLVLYLTVFIISAICIYVGRSNSNKTLTALGILVVIMLGLLRYGIGADYGGYLISYQYYVSGETFGLGYENHIFNIEPFFQLMAKLSHGLTHSPILFFGVPWALTVVLVYLGIKRMLPHATAKDFSLVWLLSICLIMPFGFDQVRQTLAIAIFFFSIRYIIDKKGIKYGVMIVLASTVHLSSIYIMSSSYLLGRWLLSKRSEKSVRRTLFNTYSLISLLVFCLYIVTAINIDILLGANIPYIDEMFRLLNDNGAIKIGVDETIPFVLFMVSSAAMFSVVKKHDEVSTLVHLFLVVGAALSPLAMFIGLGGRIAQYYLLLLPLSVYVISELRHHKPKRMQSFMLINTYSIFSLVFLSVIAVTGWTRAIPYTSIFNSSAITTQRGELAPFYSALCSLKMKNDCDVEKNKIQNDSRLWRPVW